MRFAGLVHPVQAAVEAISRRRKMCGSREGSDARPTPRPPGAPMCRPLPTAPLGSGGFPTKCPRSSFANWRNGTMDINEAISGRRSVRDYTAQVVDDETIRRLIDAAVHAPNASNGQPWTFTVVRDQGLLDRISQDAKSHLLATLPAGPRSDRYRMQLGDATFQIFYHAPALILISGSMPVRDRR